MASATSATLVIKPNACTNDAKRKALCNLPSTSSQPGTSGRRARTSASDSFCLSAILLSCCIPSGDLGNQGLEQFDNASVYGRWQRIDGGLATPRNPVGRASMHAGLKHRQLGSGAM